MVYNELEPPDSAGGIFSIMRSWIVNAHQTLRISTKIFVVTFLLVESIIVILGFTYYKYSSSTLLDAQTNYAVQMIQKSDEYLQLHLTNINHFFLSISNDNRFQSNNYEEIEKWLQENLIYSIPSAKNISVIQGNDVLASTSVFSWFLMENPEFLDQIERMEKPKQIYWLGPYFSPISQYTVTAAIEIPSERGPSKILALDIDLQYLYSSLNPWRSSSMQGELLLLDRNNRPIFGNSTYVFHDVFQRDFVLIGFDDTLLNTAWTQTELRLNPKRELFVTRSQDNLMGWQIIWIMDKTELLEPLQKSLRTTWILAVLSLFLSIGISYTISLFISRPIRKITSSIAEVSSGNFDVSIRMNRRDELGILVKHFNEMARHIKNLILNLKTVEENKKKSDFIALQSQIRPHFLFNTLNTISMVARQGQLNKADQLISSLTDQLQYSLDSSLKPVTLREELKALESYVQLMIARYHGKFRMELDIDSATLEYKIPKFVLQPIVENCIFHGLVPAKQSSLLYYRIFQGS